MPAPASFGVPPSLARPTYPVVINQESPHADGLVGWFVGQDCPPGNLPADGAQWVNHAGGPSLYTRSAASVTAIRQQSLFGVSVLKTVALMWRSQTSNFGLGAANATVSCWVYLTNALTTAGGAIYIGDDGAGFGIGIGNGTWDDTTTAPRRVVSLFGGLRWVATTTGYADGWNLLTLVIPKGGGGSRQYLNGKLILAEAGGSPNTPATLACVGAEVADARILSAGYVDARIWNRALSDKEVWTLYSPQTRWQLYKQPRRYYAFGPTIELDVPPRQVPRPKYIRLNTAGPQVKGLWAWMPAVNGTLVQAFTPGTGGFNFGTIDARNQALPVTTLTANSITPSPTPMVPSDMGMVPQSYFRGNTPGRPLPDVASVGSSLDLSGLTNLTVVYWIFPQYSTFANQTYWSSNDGGTNTLNKMTATSVVFEGPQTLTFASDPHIPGHWQMITISRTLGGIQVWRDQTLVASLTGAGAALATQGFSNGASFFIGSSSNQLASSLRSGSNALWADFRIYNRAWTQADVLHAFDPDTRWDYYWQPAYKPYYQTLTPPASTFLSRLASLGAG